MRPENRARACRGHFVETALVRVAPPLRRGPPNYPCESDVLPYYLWRDAVRPCPKLKEDHPHA